MTGRRARAVAAVAVTLALGLGGCSGDEEPKGSPSPSPSSPAAQEKAEKKGEKTPDIPTRVRVGRVAGDLKPKYRKPLTDKVRRIVDAWYDGAYLGQFPRISAKGGFAGFTPGARREALAQPRMMSNLAIAKKIDRAFARQRAVTVDVVAHRGDAVGMTAHVRLVFATRGRFARRERVDGVLHLTRDRTKPTTWEVFGYDVTRSVIR